MGVRQFGRENLGEWKLSEGSSLPLASWLLGVLLAPRVSRRTKQDSSLENQPA